jgi:hypothetical protein
VEIDEPNETKISDGNSAGESTMGQSYRRTSQAGGAWPFPWGGRTLERDNAFAMEILGSVVWELLPRDITSIFFILTFIPKRLSGMIHFFMQTGKLSPRKVLS